MVVIYNQSNSLPSSFSSSSSSSSSLLFLISLLLLLCKHRPILSRRYLSLRLSWMHLIPHCEVSIFLVLSTKHHIFLTNWNQNDFPEFLSQELTFSPPEGFECKMNYLLELSTRLSVHPVVH